MSIGCLLDTEVPSSSEENSYFVYMALLLAVDTVPVAARSSAGRVQVRIRRYGDAVRRFTVEGPITAHPRIA